MASKKRSSIQQPEAPIAEDQISPKINRYGRIIVYLILALLPLVIVPSQSPDGSYFDAKAIRCLMIELGVGSLLALVIFSWSRKRKAFWHRHRFDLPVGALLLAWLTGGIFSIYPRISLASPVWAKDDPMLLLVLGIALYIGIKEFLHEFQDITRAAWVMTLSAGAVALFGLIEYFGHIGVNTPLLGIRLTSTLDNPMFTGTYLAASIPLAAGSAFCGSSTQRNSSIIALLLMLPALVLSQSRGALLALLVAALLLFILWLTINPPKLRIIRLLAPVAFLLVLAVFFGMIAASPKLRQRFNLKKMASDQTVVTRTLYMHTAVKMFSARPITGWGPGTHLLVFQQYRPDSQIEELGSSINRGFVSALPHNLPLLIASEMGIIGLAPAIWLFILIVWELARYLRRDDRKERWLGIALAGGLCGYLVGNLSAWDNVTCAMLFWILLGLLAAGTTQKRILFPRKPEDALISQHDAKSLLALSVVAMCVTLVVVGMSGMKAIYFQRCTYDIINGKLQAKAGDVNASVTCRRAVNSAESLISLSLVPTGEEYKKLYLSFLALIEANKDEGQIIPLQQACYAAALRSAELIDRDGEILRFLIRENMARKDWATARKFMDKLLLYVPKSAQVYQLDAELLVSEGKPEEAVAQAKRTIELDPKWPQGQMKLAHYQYQLYLQKPSPALRLKTLATFARAIRQRGQLDDAYQKEYEQLQQGPSQSPK